jgi:LemA protein
MMPLLIVAGATGLVALWGALTYTAMARARSRVNKSWSGVDAQLKRRRDLVPALVQAVEAHARHEQRTMEALTDAQTAAAGSTARVFRDQAESRLSGALAAVTRAAEGYPELRASRGFGRLQEQLREVEDDIVDARRSFNSNVQRYNDLIQSVPAAPLARMGHFRGRQYFDVETSGERNTPSAPEQLNARRGGIAAA